MSYRGLVKMMKNLSKQFAIHWDGFDITALALVKIHIFVYCQTSSKHHVNNYQKTWSTKQIINKTWSTIISKEHELEMNAL
jgi:tryptophan-rich sensory protein